MKHFSCMALWRISDYAKTASGEISRRKRENAAGEKDVGSDPLPEVLVPLGANAIKLFLLCY
jgi:hypothetical protein